MRTGLLTLATVLWTSSSAYATTGQDLEEWCSHPHDSTMKSRCRGFIEGAYTSFVDVYLTAGSDASKAQMVQLEEDEAEARTTVKYLEQRTHFCPPDDMKLEQAVSAVTEWLGHNSRKLHRSGAFAVRSALRKAFPC